MELEIIKDALESSLSLLNDEYESIMTVELKSDYFEVLQKIEKSLKILEQNG